MKERCGQNMVNLNNCGPKKFREYIKDKKVFLFGAGRALDSCLDIYFGTKKVEKIVDNKSQLWGKSIVYGDGQIEIIGVFELISLVQKYGVNQCVLMITSTFYGAEIIEELDKYEKLDGLECYLQFLVRNTKEDVKPFEFTKGNARIPKKIHYIWAGGSVLPDKFKKNIESWQNYNPDYEIIRWDESNYDFTKCDYGREAYESNAWGFVCNYARLDIVYQYGGIYLDTDVEAVANFDCLLNDDAFFNMGCTDRVNLGCGFGAVPGNMLIWDMKRSFEETHFLDCSGKPGKKPCHTFVHPVIRKRGFQIINEYQKIDDVILYPCEVMSPETISILPDFYTEKTVSIHHKEGSWKNQVEKEGVDKLDKLVRRRLNNNLI